MPPSFISTLQASSRTDGSRVDQRQPARIGRHRLFPAPGEIGIDDLANAIRIAAAGHRAGGARIEIGHQVIASSPSQGPSITPPPAR